MNNAAKILTVAVLGQDWVGHRLDPNLPIANANKCVVCAHHMYNLSKSCLIYRSGLSLPNNPRSAIDGEELYRCFLKIYTVRII